MHPSLDFSRFYIVFQWFRFWKGTLCSLIVFSNCPSKSGLSGARAVCLMPLDGVLCRNLLRPSQSPDLKTQKTKKALCFLGFLGFLGLRIAKVTKNLVFFVFFGFFGFLETLGRLWSAKSLQKTKKNKKTRFLMNFAILKPNKPKKHCFFVFVFFLVF